MLTTARYRELIADTNDPLRCPRNDGACKHCAVEFQVDPKTHQTNRGFIQQKREYGGSLIFDFKRRLLFDGPISTGAYNNISMGRGGVDFHTHPAHCLNDKKCALGLPSPLDLQNITLGALFGTVAHMVYSREGTYLVQLDSKLVRHLKSCVETTTLFFADVDKTFSALHNEFLKRPNEAYKVYCRRWVRVARMSGFKIHLFKGNTVPRIRFKCMCDLLNSSEPLNPKVEVPSAIEEQFSRV